MQKNNKETKQSRERMVFIACQNHQTAWFEIDSETKL